MSLGQLGYAETRAQVHDAPQHVNEEVPLADHRLQRAQLPGRVPQPGRAHPVQGQDHDDPAVQRVLTPLLAPELHGRVHVVAALRRGEDHGDAARDPCGVL